jgi:transketolase
MKEFSSAPKFAQRIRQEALKMVAAAKASHIGGALSMADLLAVLYGGVLRVRPDEPAWAERDRFLLSKGHACVSLYATLALRGFFPVGELDSYGQDGTRLMAHASHHVPGVELSTGSLGHALPVGCGQALVARRQKKSWRVFVLLSDGELDEGSNWEAFLLAPQHRLDNVTVIVDVNGIQSLGSVSEVIELEPLADKLRAFRWSVREVDGHDHEQVQQALSTVPWEPGRPSCLLARTIKGKGVDFMENQLLWHYRNPDAAQLAEALRQISDCPAG